MSNLHQIANHDNVEINLDGVRIVLLALLPKDGTPKTIAMLRHATGCSAETIVDALLDDYMAGAVDFDVRADTYSIKQHTGATA